MRTISFLVIGTLTLTLTACGGFEPHEQLAERESAMAKYPIFGSGLLGSGKFTPPAPTQPSAPAPCIEKPLCMTDDPTVDCCRQNGENCNCRQPVIVHKPADTSCSAPKVGPNGVCYQYDLARKACNTRCLDAGFITAEWHTWKSKQAQKNIYTSGDCFKDVFGNCVKSGPTGGKNLAGGISTSGVLQQQAPTIDKEPTKVDWARCEAAGFNECKDMKAKSTKCHDCLPPPPSCNFMTWLGCGVKTANCAVSCISSLGASCAICVGNLACDCLKCFGANIQNHPVCAVLEGLSYLPL
jgi:hypothetical protein